jgi:probable aminopeptidase NPEPL1
MKRERGTSEYEEKNVSAFVDSCVDYKSNVTVLGGAVLLGSDDVADRVILLTGTRAQLLGGGLESCEELSLKHALPQSVLSGGGEASLIALIKCAREGSVCATNIGKARILIGIVPTTCSRHNCPTRPDIVTSLVQAALDDVFVTDSGLDVVSTVAIGDALSIVTAVARAGNRKFSAKKGLAERDYLAAGKPIRLLFTAAPVLPAALKMSLEAAADSVQLCQRLVDSPTNLLDTTTFAEIAERYATLLGFEIEVIRGEALREAGYGGLYGVGKAAEYPPALAVLTYKPRLAPGGLTPEKKLAMVGKGIVYDTGGLAIKTPKTNMCTMKHDMGGAAAVFAAFLAAVRMGVDCELACILCLADNAIGPKSQRNDDIVRMKSGLTIEINNTDAEGRLVLGDGVYHASALLPFEPQVIMDMATLTGAQGVATGRYHAAIYTNSGEYEARVMEAGRKSGDLVFPVLYCPEFHNREFSSKVADYKNSVANINNAQVSCAGQFIGNHLASNFRGAWVHVDLAAPATRDEGTGFGVALALETFFADRFC